MRKEEDGAGGGVKGDEKKEKKKGATDPRSRASHGGEAFRFAMPEDVSYQFVTTITAGSGEQPARATTKDEALAILLALEFVSCRTTPKAGRLSLAFSPSESTQSKALAVAAAVVERSDHPSTQRLTHLRSRVDLLQQQFGLLEALLRGDQADLRGGQIFFQPSDALGKPAQLCHLLGNRRHSVEIIDGRGFLVIMFEHTVQESLGQAGEVVVGSRCGCRSSLETLETTLG